MTRNEILIAIDRIQQDNMVWINSEGQITVDSRVDREFPALMDELHVHIENNIYEEDGEESISWGGVAEDWMNDRSHAQST